MLKRTHVKIEEARMTLAEFLDRARALMPEGGTVLYEAVREAGMAPFDAAVTEERFAEATRLRIFTADAEMRLEKPCSAAGGRVRILLAGAAGGEECAFRETAYLMRNDAAPGCRLVHREYFRKNADGMFEFSFEAAAGVRGM